MADNKNKNAAIEPPAGGGHSANKFQKPKNAKKTFVRLLGYIAQNRWKLIFVLFLVIISSVAGVAITYMIKPALATLGEILGGTITLQAGLVKLGKTIAVIAAIAVVGSVSAYVYARTMLFISQNTLNIIRRDLFDKLQDLPLKYFDTHTHGELMSRFTSDVDTVREVVSTGMVQTLSSTITVVGTFVMMLVLSPLLTGLVILMLFIMLIIIKNIGSKSAHYFREQQKAIGALNGFVEERIEGGKVVKVFCHERRSKAEFAKLNDSYRDAATSANTYASILMPIMGNLSYFNYAAVATVGAVLVIGGKAGALTLPALASFLQYSRQFSQPLTQASQQFNSVLAALAGAERIFEIIDFEPEPDEGYVKLVNAVIADDGSITESEKPTGHWAWKHPHGDGTLTYTELKGDVRFENVSFTYDGETPVLKNISLFARPGEKLAFVGSTGAGKTTITNLINRFYDVTEGRITYDGINVKKIKKDDLRRSLSMVLQDTHLFTGTVRENIAYGKLDATDEEIENAAKLANAHSFITRLPQGYDTVLNGDGANLSQGQRQLLNIARAAVADPPVLILDEATSSIDTRTERIIEKGMDKLMEGRTVFVIAHRLSTVRNADAIIVLEHGEIIERGNHDKLIADKGKYYQLYTGQFELD